MHRHANIAVCFPRNAVFTTKLNYDVNVVDSARVAHVREGRVWESAALLLIAQMRRAVCQR